MRLDALYQRRDALILLVAAVLTAPVLFLDFAQDDHLMGLAVAEQLHDFALRAPFDLFRFFDSTRVPYPVDHAWPWFASNDLRIVFFRPLSSLTHTLFFHISPNHPWVHHAYSWLLYLASVRAVQRIASRTLSEKANTTAALLATVMFAVDDGHGLAIGWIAGQNGLAAATFGLWAIAWKLDSQSPDRSQILSVICFGLAMLSGEAGIAALPTLLFLSLPGNFRDRLRAMSPYLLIVVVWGAALRAGQYHTTGSVFYTHPLRDPVTFLYNLPTRLGLMIGALAWNLWPDPWVAGPLERWVGGASLLLASWLALVVHRRLGRLAEHHRLRALWWGALLSTVPFAASDPNERSLVFASAGVAIGICASVFQRITQIGDKATWRFSKTQRLVLFVHVIVPVIVLPIRTCAVDLILGTIGTQAYRTLEPTGDLVILNAPDWLTTSTAVARRDAARSNTRTVSVILSSPRDCEATRLDDHTLRVDCPHRLFEAILSRVAMRQNVSWPAGTRFLAGPMTLTLRTEMRNGEVSANNSRDARAVADVTFVQSLDSYQFQTWSSHGYVDWELPSVGLSQTVRGVDRARSAINEVHRRLTRARSSR